ncbi:MAG: hypothetical protein AB1713_01120 [Pseudomonadota bacterium]
MTLAEYRAFLRACAERKAEETRLAMLIARSALAEDKAWTRLYKSLEAS